MTERAGQSLKACLHQQKKHQPEQNKAVGIFATKIDLAAELEISLAAVQKFSPGSRLDALQICQG